MTKYLVSGYIGFDNFGDEAIARVLIEKLKQKDAEKITLISSNPTKTRQLHNVESCGMFQFFAPLKETDVLISGGGSLLQDVTSLKSLMYYLGIIMIAQILRKKVIIFAQGIGPINSGFGKFLTKNILKKCSEISVRDQKSHELLKSWGIKSELVKDPVLELELPKYEKEDSVGVQLRSFPTITDEFLDKLAKEVVEKFPNKTIKIYSLQDSLDLAICETFAQKLKLITNSEVEVYSKLSINDVIEQISKLETLYAMRFHANVIGIKAGVKTIAINYDPKVKKLAEEYNLPVIELD